MPINIFDKNKAFLLCGPIYDLSNCNRIQMPVHIFDKNKAFSLANQPISCKIFKENKCLFIFLRKKILCFVEKIHARNIKCIPFFTPLPSFLFLVVSCFCAACLREEFGGWGPFCLIAYLRVFSVWCMLA